MSNCTLTVSHRKLETLLLPLFSVLSDWWKRDHPGFGQKHLGLGTDQYLQNKKINFNTPAMPYQLTAEASTLSPYTLSCQAIIIYIYMWEVNAMFC